MGKIPQHWVFEERQALALLGPLEVFAIALVLMLVLRHVALRLIRKRASGPASFPAVLADTLGLPSVLWAFAIALEFALTFADLPQKWAVRADQWIGAFVIVSLTLVALAASVRMITVYGERQGMPFAVAGLSRTLIRVVVFTLGLMGLLANFHLQIAPLLTALGVGGIAVALALQDTLANFFAGIHILVEHPIFVGDFIRLENGQNGVVTDIGWRTTRVRNGGNDIVVVPNTKITTGILVNYNLPEQRAVAEVAILVGHGADPDQVCAIALEEAARTEGVLETPAPLCLCDPGVLPTHLQFKLLVNVASRPEQGRVASDLRIRLLGRFRAAGVPLPQPELARARP
jgi:small-conductance mechanosensitive channel